MAFFARMNSGYPIEFDDTAHHGGGLVFCNFLSVSRAADNSSPLGFTAETAELLHVLDVRQTQGPVEERLGGGVETKVSEPAFLGQCL